MGVSSTAPISIPTPNSGRLGSLFRVPIDYLLEMYEDGRLQTAVTLPQSPTDYEQKRPSATIVTHTLNAVVREHTENHLTEISLKGVSGYAPRLGHTRDGGVSLLGGRRILEEFDLFLDEYQRRAAKKGARSVYLVFRALDERQAYRVEPKEWEWTRSAGETRFHYRWSLTLEAYGVAPSSPLVDVLSPVTGALRAAQEYIDAGAGAVALGGVALSNVRGELNEATNTLRSVGRVATALQGVVEGADGLRTFVTETLPSTWATEASRFKRAWEDAVELGVELGLTEHSEQGDSRARLGYEAERINYLATTTAGLLRVSPQTLRAAQSDPSTTEQSTQGAITTALRRASTTYTWRAGDSLQALALRVYGDATRWAEIASANGLRGARHKADGTPLSVGDVLIVPIDATPDTRGDVRRDSYATDLALDLTTGDLILEDGDVKLSTGRDNLEQAVALRCLTSRGESWVLPTYGLPLRVGGVALEREVAYLSAHVRDQLLQDDRVRDVQDVEIAVEGDQVAVHVIIEPVFGAVIDVTTPYMREA